MKTEFLAKVVMQDGCVSVTLEGLGGDPEFSHNIQLCWADGEMAGAIDVSTDGRLMGIELIGLDVELEE